MGDSGHFARKVVMLGSDVTLNKKVDDCGSLHPIRITIKTKKHLERYIGRTYRLPSQVTYSTLKATDTHLIGETILLRSPITCACKKGVCKACYGRELARTNKHITIGSYAAAIITNPISQAVLSSKHLLTTISEEIVFDENFHKFFTLSANEIVLNIQNDDIDLADYSLLIIHDNIVMISELNEGGINEFLTMFHVKNNKTGEIYEIQESTGKDLYISPELIETLNIGRKKKDVYEIPLIDLPDDERLFIMEIENNELTRPLYNIMALLDTKEKRSSMLGVNTIDDMAQTMTDLMIDSHINVMAVHSEVIINPLIRDIDNILERPNFNSYSALDNYQMLTVESALENHPSVLVGMSFQFLERQLKRPLTYKKTAKSFIDPFFKEKP